MNEQLYYLMFAFFMTHELDAIDKKEWRVFPLTAPLPEGMAKSVFIWAHVPLFILFLYSGAANPSSFAAQVLSALAIVHVGLHWLFRKHPEYKFDSLTSRALIAGAGVFGALHLASLLV